MAAIQAGDYSYLGVGRVFLRKRLVAAAMLHIGNVSKLNFGVSEDVKEQRDYTSPGGGTVAEARRITAVECSLTMLDLDKENLRRGFFGSSNSFVAGSVVDEVHVAYKDGLLALEHPIDEAEPVTVEQGSTTYVDGTDYEITSGGIMVLADGAINDGTVLQISYGYLQHDDVEALTAAAQEYELFFEGVNEAQSGRAVNVRAHRIKFGATQILDLINDDFASFELKGKLLRDNAKKGRDISKYFKIQLVSGKQE